MMQHFDIEINDPEIKTIVDQLENIAIRSIPDYKDATNLVWDLRLFSISHYNTTWDENEKKTYYESLERKILMDYAVSIIDDYNFTQLVQNN